MRPTIEPYPPSKRRIFALALLLAVTAACGGGGGEMANATPAGGPQGPPQPLPTPSAATVEIDVLALVTESVSQRYTDPTLRVDHLLDVANDVLAGAGVALQFKLRRVETVAYPDGPDTPTALDDLTFARHPAFATIPALRDAIHADLVVLIRPYANDGYCGYAWTNGVGSSDGAASATFANYGYSVAAVDCSDYVLLHELGHNLGLAHSRRETPRGGGLSYGAGYGRDNDFVTIMASPTAFNAVQLPLLSDPNRSCNGRACGVDHADPINGADSVRALGISMGQVATYR